jgi:hypothetical protein
MYAFLNPWNIEIVSSNSREAMSVYVCLEQKLPCGGVEFNIVLWFSLCSFYVLVCIKILIIPTNAQFYNLCISCYYLAPTCFGVSFLEMEITQKHVGACNRKYA